MARTGPAGTEKFLLKKDYACVKGAVDFNRPIVFVASRPSQGASDTDIKAETSQPGVTWKSKSSLGT
jgi:hypothetical protein